jgi:tetratricopeptide (TPR) repeat protein
VRKAVRRKPGGRWGRCALLLLLLWAAPGRAQPLGWEARYQACDAEIEAWRLAAGAACVAALGHEAVGADLLHFLEAKLAFYAGDLPRARARIDAIEAEAASRNVTALGALLTRYEQVMARYPARELGRAGPSRLRYRLPRDEIFALLMPARVHEARARVQDLLGDDPRAPAEIIVAGSAEDLAALSGTPLEDVRAHRMIGATRYNRVILLSPSVTPEAVSWTENLQHELGHHALVLLGGRELPFWLQEGVVTWLDRRFQTPSGRRWALPPRRAAKAFFAGGARHPDTYELRVDAILLGYLCVRGMIHRLGAPILRRVITGDERVSERRLIRLLMEEWQREAEDPVFTSSGEPGVVAPRRVARAVGLARMLLKRGHRRAAIVQLRKAWRASPTVAHGLMLLPLVVDASDWTAADELCRRLPERDAEGYLFRFLCGQLHLALEQYEEAARIFERAVEFRPYAVETHRLLHGALDRLRRSRRKLDARMILKILAPEEELP